MTQLKEEGAELLPGSFRLGGQTMLRCVMSVQTTMPTSHRLKLNPQTYQLTCILYNLGKIRFIIIPFGLALFFEALMVKWDCLSKTLALDSSLGMLPGGNCPVDSHVTSDSCHH